VFIAISIKVIKSQKKDSLNKVLCARILLRDFLLALSKKVLPIEKKIEISI
jgi:hypothetical protein